MKANSIYNLPTLEKFTNSERANFAASWETPVYKMATYLFAAVDGHPYCSLLDRAKLLRLVFSTEGKPFYAADVIGASEKLGGWMTGLSIYGIVRATGNRREEMIPLPSGLYRKVEAQEWTLAYPIADLRNAYDEIKMFVVDRL